MRKDHYESTIVGGISKGKSRQEIAEELGISASAVCHWLRVRGLAKPRTTMACDDGESLKILRILGETKRPMEICRIVGVTTGKHWRRWLNGDRQISRRAAERLRNYWQCGRADADMPKDRIKRLMPSRAPQWYGARCRSCNKSQRIKAIALTHASQPRCRMCGGSLMLSAAAQKRLSEVVRAKSC